MLSFATLDKEKPLSAVLKVVGVGGGGCNALESMIKRGLAGVEFIAVNTDAQVLASSNAHQKVQVGLSITKGLGAGADPNVGKKAVEEDREKLAEILEGSDMVFVCAGMGGGTGTGGAPIVASIAKSIGALVVGIVTKPFSWEGRRRMTNAENGIIELKQYVDSLIVIPNQRLLNVLEKNTPVDAAFDKPNDVLYEATRGIADIINYKGKINVDFADVRTVMNQSGEALMGCGIASGENRAIEAAQKAILSPLLEGVNIKGAKNILMNITASNNFSYDELEAGNNVIFDAAGQEASVIFGFVEKEEMNDYVSYTVIATGFQAKQASYETVTEETKTQKKEEIFKGGFNYLNNINTAEIDKQDLETPTIFRVGNKSPLITGSPDSSGSLNSGFYLNWNKDVKRKEEEQEEEESSSSFLKMIMD